MTSDTLLAAANCQPIDQSVAPDLFMMISPDVQQLLMNGKWKRIKNAMFALLDHGADVNATDSHGNTALILIASSPQNQCDSISLLIEQGADINHANKRVQTTLMRAEQSGWIEAVQLLASK